MAILPVRGIGRKACPPQRRRAEGGMGPRGDRGSVQGAGQCAGRPPMPNTRLGGPSSDCGVSCCWGGSSGLRCKGGGCVPMGRGRANQGQANLRMRVGVACA